MKMSLILVLTIIFTLVVLVTPTLAESIKWMPLKWQQSDWSKQDTTMQTAVSLFIIADWAQTRYIATNPSVFSETNPILGVHPSVEEVDKYFAICLVGNTLISYILPKDYRKYWQALSLSMEVGYVNHNLDLGVKMKF